MSTPYLKSGGVSFDIDVIEAQVAGVTNRDGDPVHLYYAYYREAGKKDWKMIFDVDGKRPFLNSTAARCLETASEFIENHDNL